MELTLISYCLLGLLIFCLLIQLYFSLYYHRKLAFIKIAPIPENSGRPLSVVVCARNEAENLQLNLPALLEQNYANFEVVVVDDRSWDGTGDILKEFSKQYPHLKIVTVTDGDKFIAGKKFALTMGIKAASNEWLVFTDADCLPASQNWLQGMQQPENDQIDFVLGYSPYIKNKGLLTALICFETFFTAVNYLSFALRKRPYMGVGRNMAYKKSLFFKHRGFAAHMHIPSGDDDLFVNAHANKRNTLVQIHKDTHVWTEPKASLAAYIRQKKRHFGAGKLYKFKDKFVLSLQIFFQFLFYVLLIACMFFKETMYPALGIFALSILIRCFIYPRLLSRLSYRKLRFWFPLLDILLFIFLVFNSLVSIFIKKVRWK